VSNFEASISFYSDSDNNGNSGFNSAAFERFKNSNNFLNGTSSSIQIHFDDSSQDGNFNY